MELEDAIQIALLTLKETIEGEMNGETVEIGKSKRYLLHVNKTHTLQALLENQPTIYLALKVLREHRAQDSAS